MKVTMLGHATLLIEVDGKTILTDPWLTEPLYFGQLTHYGNWKSPDPLPQIDMVLVSHGHQDHFDPATLKKISKDTPVVIFKGYKKAAEKNGFTDVRPVGAGDKTSVGSLEISAMTGKHPGGIATYMVRGEEGKVYFGGDSIYTPELEKALADTRPHVCLMPISGGAFGPLRFHMNAKEAARLVQASGAKACVPIHYHFTLKKPSFNRFLMKENCLEEFQGEMKKISPETAVTVLEYGHAWEG